MNKFASLNKLFALEIDYLLLKFNKISVNGIKIKLPVAESTCEVWVGFVLAL